MTYLKIFLFEKKENGDLQGRCYLSKHLRFLKKQLRHARSNAKGRNHFGNILTQTADFRINAESRTEFRNVAK